jgi:hypothetical protein
MPFWFDYALRNPFSYNPQLGDQMPIDRFGRNVEKWEWGFDLLTDCNGKRWWVVQVGIGVYKCLAPEAFVTDAELESLYEGYARFMKMLGNCENFPYYLSKIWDSRR